MNKHAKIMAVLGILALCGSALAVDGNEPISHWEFNEGGGTTAYDSAGGNHGTVRGAKWTTGPIDGALQFDGQDDYVSCGNDESLAITDNLTIAVWVKRTARGGSSNEIIVSKYNGSHYSYRLLFHGTNVVRWWLTQSGTSSNRAFADSTVTITDFRWHFIVATFESGTLRIYIDGVDKTVSGEGNITSIKATTEPLFIGQENSGSYFNGLIDDVRIYNKALSAEEAQQLYQDGLGDVVGLEISGPEEVVRNCEAQYTALAYYADGQARDVTNWAIWWVEPNNVASIDAGLLYPKPGNEPLDVTIYVQFTKGEHIIETGMTVHVSLGNIWYVPTDYETIQEAIDAAECGDTVIVSDGTYTGVGNKNIDFKGKAITVRSENGPENCIIDCENSGRGFYFQCGEGLLSVLDGFTITNGDTGVGGAIECERGSSPTIKNCIIRGNAAYASGGGIDCWRSSPTISDCIIAENSSIGGGGLVFYKSSSTIVNCTITGNSAEGGGGLVFCKSSSTIVNCTITGNSAEDNGGGIFCYGGNLTITNCTITDNSADYGGGIHCNGSSPSITNCIIADNAANVHGAGIYSKWRGSNPVIKNCTITDNVAGNKGGGVRCYKSSPAISNSILWNNSPDSIASRDSSPTVTYSDVQGAWQGEGNIDADPLLTPDDYHLQVGSTCIDAGTDAGVYTDIEGNIRPFDFPGVDNNGELPDFDMGAYEATAHEARLLILPRVINRKSSKPRVMAWVHLPQGITKDQIDTDTPLILYPGNIEAMRQFVIGNRRGAVSILASFNKAELMDAIPANGRVGLQVLGYLIEPGQYYSGCDTIRIIPRLSKPQRQLKQIVLRRQK